MDKAKLLENYSKGLGSTGKTANLYFKFVQDFLNFADNLDRETINNYMEHLRKTHHYSVGTLNLIFRAIRTLYHRNERLLAEQGVEWSFRRGEGPQVSEDDVDAPALDPDVVIEMINKIREDGEPDERAFLAISTTYGIRKVEMRKLTQESINLKGKTIYIATQKHGRARTHIIPDEIIPQLEGYDFDRKVSDYGLLSLWYQLENKINLRHTDQVGWHSLRRTLDTLLLDKLVPTVVMSFMRWKQKTSSNMPYRYSAQRFVGREGTTTKVIGEAKDVDSKVFAVHPFLRYWR